MADRRNGPQWSILHVHTLPIVSGSGINTLLTMKGSVARGHRVALACESRGRLTEESEQAGIEIRVIPQMGREIHAFKDLSAVAALTRLMRNERYDIVHTHNSKAGFVGRLAAKLAGVPEIIHTVHGFAFHDAESALRRSLFRILERRAARWCDGIIYISKPLEDWADSERIGAKTPRVVIYSGIDVDAFRRADPERVRRELGIERDTLVVGMVSKLWEGKGHEVLLHAWKRVLDAWTDGSAPLLLLVGEGPLESNLRETAERLGISSSVKFIGFRSDIANITAGLDLAVLPSAFEGMGRVVLEAMAAGKPVVASRVGGIPDLVQDGRTGFLVSPGDTFALGSKLALLLKDKRLRLDLGEAAASAIQPQHTAEYMVQRIHEFYEQVMQTKLAGRDGGRRLM